MFKFLVIAAVVTPMLIIQSGSAEACSCPPVEGLLDSFPEDGATDVPTDVVPWVAAGGSVNLVTKDGHNVPIQREFTQVSFGGCTTYQQLEPSEPLEPNTEYLLQAGQPQLADAGSKETFSFVTGSGPLEASIPAAPDVELAVFDASEFTNSCVYATRQACLYSEFDGLLDVRFETSDGERHLLGPISQVNRLLFSEAPMQSCVEVRARDIAGRLSDPSTLCVRTDSGPTIANDGTGAIFADCALQSIRDAIVDPSATQVDGGMSHDASKDRDSAAADHAAPGAASDDDSSSGCQMGHGAGGSSAAWLLALGIGLLRRFQKR